ncbi:MAG: hypothetical protein AVDCRST_MAG12-2030, partial [uncultured Rubrobacteraceae bacterium]
AARLPGTAPARRLPAVVRRLGQAVARLDPPRALGPVRAPLPPGLLGPVPARGTARPRQRQHRPAARLASPVQDPGPRSGSPRRPGGHGDRAVAQPQRRPARLRHRPAPLVRDRLRDQGGDAKDDGDLLRDDHRRRDRRRAAPARAVSGGAGHPIPRPCLAALLGRGQRRRLRPDGRDRGPSARAVAAPRAVRVVGDQRRAVVSARVYAGVPPDRTARRLPRHPPPARARSQPI